LYLLHPLRSANGWGDDGIGTPGRIDSIVDPFRVWLVRRHIRARSAGRPVILLSPTLANYLPLITRVFPDAKFVHLQRNPLDTIASMKKFLAKNACGGFWDRYRDHRYGGRLFATRSALVHRSHQFRWRSLIHPGYLGVRPAGFQAAAKRPLAAFLSWYYCANQRDILAGLSGQPASRRRTLHYEQMVSDYPEAIGGLMDFICGSDRQFDTPRPHDGVKSGTVGRRKQYYDEDEIQIIRNFLIDHAPREVLVPYGLDCRDALGEAAAAFSVSSVCENDITANKRDG